MKPRKPLPEPLDRVPFTTRQGRRAGLGRQRLRGSDLAHPFRGVYNAIEGDLGIDDLCRTLQARLPGDAYFCGATAALIMRIPLPRRLEQPVPVHVAVPSPKTAPTGKGIRGHSIRTHSSDMRSWGGIRVGSPEQTWCLVAAKLSVPELVAAGDYLIHRRMPLTGTGQLAIAVDRHGSRAGIATLREALPLLDERSESPKESELRVIFVLAGMPGLEVNLPIRTRDGYRYRADLAFPSRKTIVEYQSRFHESAVDFRRDMTRISRLEADGWVVVQVNYDDLADPDELVRRVIRILESRPVFD